MIFTVKKKTHYIYVTTRNRTEDKKIIICCVAVDERRTEWINYNKNGKQADPIYFRKNLIAFN